jgi:phenylacetic acid degradation operon negative regulatory protein
MRIEGELLLEFFLFGVELLTRQDCALILLGARETRGSRRLDAFLERLRQKHLLEQSGRGKTAKFTITDAGRQRLQPLDPSQNWNRAWDGKWRVFTFDMPSNRRKDRMLLWRTLRNQRFGLLQRSVWIWPHETEFILQSIVDATGIPECFCGLEASRVFLCDDEEIVASSWDFEEITRRHRSYLEHAVATPANAKRSPDLVDLARLVRIEQAAYRYALSLDPLLPRALWPKSYRGPALLERHEQFRAALGRRLRDLIAA